MVSRRELCKCGHAKDTHFDKKHSCLGMRCECKVFIDEDDDTPETERTPKPSNPRWGSGRPHLPHCLCDACYEWMIRSRGY